MASYEFSYSSPETVSVTPEKFLELRSFCPEIKAIRIIPPSLEHNDYGQILVLASSMKKESLQDVQLSE